MPRDFLVFPGAFFFIFLANYVECGDKLSGNVHIFSESFQKQTIRRLKSESPSLSESPQKASQFLSQLTANATNSSGLWKIHVEIERSGEVRLDTGLDSAVQEVRDEDEIIANQTYYFLKDLFHNHQHHDAKSDSIISTVLVTSAETKSWLDVVHHSLYRSIIRYKRYQTEKQLTKSLGILAYTEAFERTFRDEGEIKKFNSDQLKESLAIAQDEARTSRQIRISFLQTVTNIFFAFFAFLVSLSFLLRLSGDIEIDVDPIIGTIAALVVGNFSESIGAVIILAVVSGFTIHAIDPSDIRFVRGLTRTFQGLRMRYYTITNLVISCFFTYLGWYLLLEVGA